MIAHAREEAPNECCGMIGGLDGEAKTVVRITNTEASPLRYEMDHQEQYNATKELEEADQEVIGHYHSHTRTAAYPSQTDINFAELLADNVHVIVSLQDPEQPVVRGFWIRDGQIDEAELDVV
jgi:proteasome lid subunit RPN8/RPN11